MQRTTLAQPEIGASRRQKVTTVENSESILRSATAYCQTAWGSVCVRTFTLSNCEQKKHTSQVATSKTAQQQHQLQIRVVATPPAASTATATGETASAPNATAVKRDGSSVTQGNTFCHCPQSSIYFSREKERERGNGAAAIPQDTASVIFIITRSDGSHRGANLYAAAVVSRALAPLPG